MTTTTKKNGKTSSATKAPKKASKAKTATQAPVKKASKPRTAKAATQAPVAGIPAEKVAKLSAAEKKLLAKMQAEAKTKAKPRLKQLLPGGTVEAEVVTKKGNKVVSRETIKLTQKAAMTLAALQDLTPQHKDGIPKAALFAAVVRLFGIETSQDGFRVNEQCHLLEAAGLATMQRIGQGAAQYRAATARGMSVVLPEISRIG